jgi:GMP synthase-like glutamine amidotransferase
MKIGILETGEVPPPLDESHGDYPEMFARLLRTADPSLEFAVYRVIDNELPESVTECDAWLVTGSRHGVYDDLPWIEPLKAFLGKAYRAHVPIVGICFGHQILAEALGGRAEKSHKGWGVGVHHYNIHRKPAWMTGVGMDFALNALHQDQVVELPGEAEVVAGSEFCPYAVLAYDDDAISIQPHPEFRTEYLRDLIEFRRGSSFDDAVADSGLESLGEPIQTEQVARWIVQFLRERLGAERESA